MFDYPPANPLGKGEVVGQSGGISAVDAPLAVLRGLGNENLSFGWG
jgi:hypothetical protein